MPNTDRRIQDVLDRLVRDGDEIGVQVAAYLDGKLVVDAWAGLADEATKRPVPGDTLFTAFSVSRGNTATCVHILADRGLIDYDVPLLASRPPPP